MYYTAKGLIEAYHFSRRRSRAGEHIISGEAVFVADRFRRIRLKCLMPELEFHV